MPSKNASRALIGALGLCLLAHLFLLPFCFNWHGSGISALFNPTFSLHERLHRGARAWGKQTLKGPTYLIGTLYHLLRYSPTPGQGVYGRDGWVFLGNAYEQSLAQVLHRHPLPPGRPERLVAQSRRLAACAAAYGTQMLILVAPNKGSLYPERLPEPLGPEPALLALWQPACPDLVLDIQGPLLQKKASVALSSPYNTHWSDAAAGLAWDCLRERLASFWDLSAAPRAWCQPLSIRWEQGDLAQLLRFFARNPVPTLPLPETHGTYTLSNGAPQPISAPLRLEAIYGDPTVHHPAAPVQKRLLIIGDSNVAALSPYLNATFGTLFYRSLYNGFDNAQAESRLEPLLRQLHPDLLLWVIAERHLPKLWE